MPRATTAELEAGLRARLSSSLPLDARCRLAINSLTSPLPVPGKQELVLAWLLAGLEQKYQADNTDQEVEGQTLLWTAVQTALPALQCLPAGAAQTVPDSLLDLVAVADLTRPEVGGAVHGLVELAASLVPLQPAWPALLTCLATRAPPSIHPALTGALPRLLPGLTPSDCAPLIAAVSHLPAHPAITAAAAQLLFNNLDPLPVTFSLLAGQVEGKGGGLLVSTLTAGCRPELLLAACPATPAWLPAKLVSLLVSCQGGPGMLDQDSLAGAELLAGIKQHLQQQEQAVPLAVLLQPVLPLDLSLELRPGLTVAAWLSAALGWAAGREDAEQLGRTVELLHTHHPHLLEGRDLQSRTPRSEVAPSLPTLPRPLNNQLTWSRPHPSDCSDPPHPPHCLRWRCPAKLPRSPVRRWCSAASCRCCCPPRPLGAEMKRAAS